ncbi:MAG: hypothetical protein ACT4OI_02495 [Methanobacteriota archaeon]
MGVIHDVTSGERQAKVLDANRPVAVDFRRERCVWCTPLESEYEAIAEERSDKNPDIVVCEVCGLGYADEATAVACQA